MIVTKLNLGDSLPLTCSRTGTCCHGKTVHVNPWELATIAKAKGLSSRDFATEFCDWGGIKLKFEGEIGYKNQHSCSQYIEDFGCIREYDLFGCVFYSFLDGYFYPMDYHKNMWAYHVVDIDVNDGDRKNYIFAR